jgi:hypothetical protein
MILKTLVSLLTMSVIISSACNAEEDQVLFSAPYKVRILNQKSESMSALPDDSNVPIPSVVEPTPLPDSQKKASHSNVNESKSPSPEASDKEAVGDTSNSVSASNDLPSNLQIVAPKNVKPGWRGKLFNAQFNNPFSINLAPEIQTSSSPSYLKDQFDQLARDISGIIRFQDRDALLINGQMVKEGEAVRLIKKGHSKAGVNSKSSASSNDASSPIATFAGMKDKNTARFVVGDTEVEVPLFPDSMNGSLVKMQRSGTGTFINQDGCFVIAANLIPDASDVNSTLTIKTSFGTYPAKIIEKNSDYNLALCAIETFTQVSLPQWEVTDFSDWEKSDVLAFNPQDPQANQVPQYYHLSRFDKNEAWLIGCPMFYNGKMAGVLAQKGDKIVVLGKNELMDAFPKLANYKSNKRVETKLEEISKQPPVFQSIVGSVSVETKTK